MCTIYNNEKAYLIYQSLFEINWNRASLLSGLSGLLFSSLNQIYVIIICVYWFELFSQVSDVAHGPLVIFWHFILQIKNNCRSGSVLDRSPCIQEIRFVSQSQKIQVLKGGTDSYTAKHSTTIVSVTCPQRWPLQTDDPWYSGCGRLKNLHCSMAMSTEHRSKF